MLGINKVKNNTKPVGKTTSGQVFAAKTQQRLAKLFLGTPIVKAVMIISLPSMIMSLMVALYTFSDQIMMANLIPGFHKFETYFNQHSSITYSDLINEMVKLNKIPGINLTIYDSKIIVRNAVADSAPITVFLIASTLLIGNGTSINFSRANGKGDLDRAQKVWATGFYSNLTWGVIVMISLFALCVPIIQLENGNPLAQLEQVKDKIVQVKGQETYNNIHNLYSEANNWILSYARNFSFILIGGLLFNMFDLFFSLLIITEGKQKMVVFAAVVSNVVNIILDFIFIYYAQLAMVGGAIATVIGWSFNCSWYVLQIWLMNKKNDTCITFSYLNFKKLHWDWKLIQQIFFNGLASFLRNVSMGIAVWWQLFMFAHLVIPYATTGGQAAASITNFYGAVNPIYNLFFPVILGTIQGSRIMCSYLHGARNFKRFRQAYWVAMMIGFVYGLSVLLIIGIGLNKYFLGFFNIDLGEKQNQIASLMLLIMLAQLPVYAFTVGGQVIFQATSRSVNSCVCALMQGIFCNIPVSLVMAGISISISNEYLFLWTPLLVMFCSSTIILIWTIWYMKKYFSDDILSWKIKTMQSRGWFDPARIKSN